MSRPARIPLPTRDGVSASTVATPSGPWATVLDFLAERIPAVAREDWAQRMARGEVLDARGQPLPPQAPFRAQTRLHYWRSLPFEHRIPFEETIVFQDEFLVVADKPHFLPVTPKGRYVQETLLVRLKRRTGIDTLVPMHRIDLETAGLVAFTVQPHTRDAYQSLLRDALVHKTYEAIAPWRDDLNWPQQRLSRLQESAHFMAMEEAEGEPNADTLIEPIEVMGAWARYRLTPRTGQKHQLRAHLCALGLPIAGDRIYPELLPAPPADAPPDFSRPLQLLARSLRFTDPVTGQLRCFDSPRRLDLGHWLAQATRRTA
ncbi:MAG: pseudouridine synthase [Proteobacteria bacterium]|uniref:pseudouridine synthase n=1 Tax=Aquabacterium sp. TaxID=1872578 RepID=UPI0035C699E2|nr:pseudouridine synthase [Pseudomonadota bacterium]